MVRVTAGHVSGPSAQRERQKHHTHELKLDGSGKATLKSL